MMASCASDGDVIDDVDGDDCGGEGDDYFEFYFNYSKEFLLLKGNSV